MSSFPTHETASRIATAARAMGFAVKRDAASPISKSVYLRCDEIKVRVADHAALSLHEVDIDVHVNQPWLGSVDAEKAIEWLQGRIGNNVLSPRKSRDAFFGTKPNKTKKA